jgi:hypothetical protein
LRILLAIRPSIQLDLRGQSLEKPQPVHDRVSAYDAMDVVRTSEGFACLGVLDANEDDYTGSKIFLLSD